MKIKTLFLTLMICGACYCSAAETPAPAAQAAPAAAETAAPANLKAQHRGKSGYTEHKLFGNGKIQFHKEKIPLKKSLKTLYHLCTDYAI